MFSEMNSFHCIRVKEHEEIALNCWKKKKILSTHIKVSSRLNIGIFHKRNFLFSILKDQQTFSSEQANTPTQSLMDDLFVIKIFVDLLPQVNSMKWFLD